MHREAHFDIAALVAQNAFAGDRVDEAGLAAPQRSEHRDAPALGPQAVFVRLRVEAGPGFGRHPLAAGSRVQFAPSALLRGHSPRPVSSA